MAWRRSELMVLRLPRPICAAWRQRVSLVDSYLVVNWSWQSYSHNARHTGSYWLVLCINDMWDHLLYFSYVFYFVYNPDRVLYYCSGVARTQSFRPMAMRLSSEGRIAIGWGAVSASYRKQGCRAQHNNALWVGPASGQYRCWAGQISCMGKVALCIVCNFLFCV